MVYIRNKRVKGMNYSYLVRSIWDKKKKVSKQETIKYLGRTEKITLDNIPEDYIEKCNKANKLFMLYKDKLNPRELPFHNSLRNISELMVFLIKDCNISEKRVHSAIRKMQYTY